MWDLGTWFSGGLDHAALMVGLSDLRHLFQPKLFSFWNGAGTAMIEKGAYLDSNFSYQQNL